MVSLAYIKTVQTQTHCAVASSCGVSPLKTTIATLCGCSPEINLAGVVRDGDRAENYGILFDFEPCDYLWRQSKRKTPKARFVERRA